MKPVYRYAISIVGGALVLALLIWLTPMIPLPSWDPLASVLFFLLISFTTTFGVPLAGGSVSLLPMTTVAGFLVLGQVPTGWAAFGGTIAYAIARNVWSEQLSGQRGAGGLALVAVTSANVAMHVGSVLACGAVFQWAGGATPLTSVDLTNLPRLLLLGLTYLAVNYLVAGAYIAGRGREALGLYARSLPNLVLYEGAPLLVAPLVALIYSQLGLAQFLLFSLLLVTASLITRDLARSRRRLERRLRELGSLQAVGQALSASLETDRILSAIYDQVSKLMRARNFYVALYDPDADEVSFPLTYEDAERVEWGSRRTGGGLTEYVLREREPLLIRSDVERVLEELGIESIGRTAVSWLGVPITAGDEALGVIAVQSYTQTEIYDISHQEVLTTIAAQAAAAIQNARLYEQTDEALAQRVQELDSILRTSREGMLLLDLDRRVLAVNRALADSVGVAQLEFDGQQIDLSHVGDGRSLAELVGYSQDSLRADCEAAGTAEVGARKEIVILGPEDRYFERTLTAVRDRAGEVTGWLIVLRDISEEIELANLRDDMMHMLVHDLRSPLSVVRSGLDLMGRAFESQSEENFGTLLDIGRQNADRMLGMVNELLDIGKMESGQLPVHPEHVEAGALLREVVERLAPLAREAEISVHVTVEDELPTLHVDRALMARVINNLLDNAIKFTPDGGRIEMWARSDAEISSEYVLVGVSDSGPGIPPEAQARLFKKFQQVISNEGRRTGTGLGLPFCKLAVEAHGGRIWAESKVGEGSTFTMVLPVVR
jgi:PAS domain S-box-containing protein